MEETKNINIKTYNDFLAQLTALKDDEEMCARLSFWKWCSKHRQNIHNVFVECIENELVKLGLEPYKINRNMDCLVKFKNKAEAIIQIGACEVNLFICKL